MRAIAAEYAKLLGAITFRDYTSRIIEMIYYRIESDLSRAWITKAIAFDDLL